MPSAFNMRALCIALASTCAVLTCHAEGSASSASSAGSASSGSVSTSIKGSSNSSTGDTKVAEGPYRVMDVQDVAEAATSPGQKPMVQLTLRATAPGPVREFVLELPRQALAERPLNTGDLVQANQRPYGFEFARGDTRQAFFLVLTDDWQRDLESHPVTL